MPAERRFSQSAPDNYIARPDRCVAELAARQWGVVTAAELRELGLTRDAVAVRRRRGWLHRVHQGVYAVGHPGVAWEGEMLAAVKACGAGALLSHYSAAELWGYVDRMDRMPDVTIPTASPRKRRGIRIHRCPGMASEDHRVERGVPVTAPARTLLDLAALIDGTQLRRAVRGALGSGSVSHRQLQRVLRRYPGRRGCAGLAAVITSGAAPTKSERESDVLDLILEGGFEHPDVNRPLLIEGRRVVPDLRWPEQRLTLEVDSDAWHDDPLARADDRERQALLERHGETVLRTHWRDAIRAPRRLLARLAAAGAPRAGLSPCRAA